GAPQRAVPRSPTAWGEVRIDSGGARRAASPQREARTRRPPRSSLLRAADSRGPLTRPEPILSRVGVRHGGCGEGAREKRPPHRGAKHGGQEGGQGPVPAPAPPRKGGGGTCGGRPPRGAPP